MPDAELREKIFGRIKAEWHDCIGLLLKIMEQDRLLQGNPLLERSVRNRFPYLDPLNHVQVELLKEHRAQNPDEQVLRGIQITINGVSAGLRYGLTKVVPGRAKTREPQMRDCASGNLGIPGSPLCGAPE